MTLLTILVFKGRFNNNSKCYVNCHETSLVIIILIGGLTNNNDNARTFSNDGSLSGAWLYCVPKKGELKMDNASFRTACCD